MQCPNSGIAAVLAYSALADGRPVRGPALSSAVRLPSKTVSRAAYESAAPKCPRDFVAHWVSGTRAQKRGQNAASAVASMLLAGSILCYFVAETAQFPVTSVSLERCSSLHSRCSSWALAAAEPAMPRAPSRALAEPQARDWGQTRAVRKASRRRARAAPTRTAPFRVVGLVSDQIRFTRAAQSIIHRSPAAKPRNVPCASFAATTRVRLTQA